MSIKRNLLAIVLAFLLLLFLALTTAIINRLYIIKNAWDLPDFSHEMGEKKDFMLAMPDGIKLRTLQQLPKGEGPWPTILIRNPYDTLGTDLLNVFCELFVNYGYACIYQETRGQILSEGEWEPLVNEPKDTSSTLYWIADQRWNDGNIGMWGISYLALTQWGGAMDYPKELKTFVPTSIGTDFHKVIYEKGNFRLFMTLWTLLMSDRGINVEGVMKFWEAAEHFPHADVDEKYAGKKLKWYQEWIRDVGSNDFTWQREDAVSIKNVAANLNIPVLIYEGWYDPFFKAQLQDYQNLASRERSRMVIGPWSHIQQVATSLDINVDDAMKMGMQENLVWFEYHLKGISNADASGYIQTFDLGANKWVRRASWPPATETKTFQLTHLTESNNCSGGQLSLIEPNIMSEEGDALAENDIEEIMSEAAIEAINKIPSEKISYSYDPKNPVQSRGGEAFLGPLNSKVAPGALTQNGFCERDDVLTFSSPELENDMTIAGTILVKLKVSSDAEDTAFTAKLMDVNPKGVAVNIRDTISTLSYRNHSPEALSYIPNDIIDVTLDMWAIEWTLKKGHRLRLDISSSNFPAYNIHSNYAGSWAAQDSVKMAKQTIYSGSLVELPLVKLPVINN